ncbi:uncharacterized protein LOC126665222 [Mercurialis annua]|uniref:uncharacterized protein LOC126665222 n=1 Tax=Mercurialis annua TaxID=3986 RepID=UPI00215E30AD|nr:uncharacterized protein LOC126665222 [Mercurialis annua]
MADQVINAPAAHRLRDIQRPVVVNNPSCIRITDEAHNYELKTIHLNMLPQFNGTTLDDPLAFIKEFYSVVETFPLNRLTEGELRKRCFPYCMKMSARTWLLNLPEGSVNTWPDVYDAFIMKYYSPQKTLDLRGKIYNFTQLDGEPFHEAWERFKMLLAQCSHHCFDELLLTQMFFEGLTMSGQTLVETASGGSYGEKTATEINNFFENVALNSQQRAIRGRRAAVHEVSSHHDVMYANRVQPEEINFVGNNQNKPPRNDPYPNTNNPEWQNHPNVLWRDSNNVKLQRPSEFHQNRPTPPLQEKKPSLEEMMVQFMANQNGHNNKMEQRISQIEQSFQSSIHDVELQLGKLANKARMKLMKHKKNKAGKSVAINERTKNKVVEESTIEKPPPKIKEYVPPIPYPRRQMKRINELNFQKLLNIFKKIQINIPFTEALAQIPSYAKFLKEIISNKNKLEEYATVGLTEECSARLQRKLPPKLKDPGIFSIPCVIGNVDVANCLCDLGASINLMPLWLVRKLRITKMKPTTVSLQLADRSIK